MKNTAKLEQYRVLWVGAGRMGGAILRRFAAHFPFVDITVLDPHVRTLSNLPVPVENRVEEFSSLPTHSNFNLVLLGVKPSVFPGTCKELRQVLTRDALAVSIMAGVDTTTLKNGLGSDRKVVRAMPNLPSELGAGVTLAFAPDEVEPSTKELFERVFSPTGSIHWVKDEDLIHAGTAISGSGPAYFFAFTQALAQAGVKRGLPEDLAESLASRTMVGAAALLSEYGDPEKLRNQVTSPGGTTSAALDVFLQEEALPLLVERATEAAATRSKQLQKDSVIE